MSNTLKLVAALGLVGFLSACGGSVPTEEVVYVDPAPVAAQPLFTGKYN
ncbi:MAG: hypothetical protein ACI9KS_000230 [Sulfitobacter sp.]|jgi:hypothetical protein